MLTGFVPPLLKHNAVHNNTEHKVRQYMVQQHTVQFIVL